MGELYGWAAGALGVFFIAVLAWFNGRSKAKTVLNEQLVKSTKAVAEHQVTASKEAAHVDQKINNSTDADVDKQLLDKWSRPGSR